MKIPTDRQFLTMGNRRCLMMLCLLPASLCPASEIVSWNVRLSQFTHETRENIGVRLESPPEASPFFNDEDELWDLKPVGGWVFETDPPLEWAVWNATTRRLVTKSGWSSVSQLSRHFEIEKWPRQCRLVAEVLEIPVDRPAPSSDSQPVATLTWLARSGSPFESSVETHSTLAASGTATIAEDEGILIDLQLKAGFSIRGLPRRDAEFSVTLKQGEPLWTVRDHDGESGFDLRITATVELMDGTPLHEAVLRQENGSAVPLTPDRSPMRKQRIGQGGWLASAYVPDGTFEARWNLPDDPVPPLLEDPFAPGDLPVREEKFIDPPEVLEQWLTGSFLDLRTEFQQTGITVGENDFAGYNPLAKRMWFFTESPDQLDQFEMMFGGGMRSPLMTIVTTGPERPMRLLSRSGQRASLIRTDRDGTVLASMGIEPTIGETDEVIDLLLDYRETFGNSVRSYKSSVRVADGDSVEVLSGPSPADPPLRVTAKGFRHEKP